MVAANGREGGRMIAPFPGVLKLGSQGEAVEAVKRAVFRALGDDFSWKEFMAQTPAVRQTFGSFFVVTLDHYKLTVGLRDDGLYDRPTHLKLEADKRKGTKQPAFDARAISLLKQAVQAPTLELCYPHPIGANSVVCQGLHPTAGLDGNWACDFCAPGGTPVVAVEKAEIVKLSGHPPTQVINVAIGIFGWNIHYRTSAGYRYFSTHYGTRKCKVGQKVKPGTLLGEVGRWPGDPGRSHTHLGVTSPRGIADAKQRILAVSNAPRVPLL
jgi:hypothetical protein